MASKIKSLTIVNQQGTQAYYIGTKYNGLLLAKIEDNSAEYEDSLVVIYRGYTENKDVVFEAINAPIDVQYEAV